MKDKGSKLIVCSKSTFNVYQTAKQFKKDQIVNLELLGRNVAFILFLFRFRYTREIFVSDCTDNAFLACMRNNKKFKCDHDCTKILAGDGLVTELTFARGNFRAEHLIIKYTGDLRI